MADIEKIDGMLYERTAIATKPEELIKQEPAECFAGIDTPVTVDDKSSLSV